MSTRRSLLVALVLGVLVLGGAGLALGAGGRTDVGLDAPPPPGGGAGSDVVRMSPDGLAHPAGQAVGNQLQRHYDAINARDHAAWAETVVAGRAAALPPAAFIQAYASTRDGSIRVERIDDAATGGLLVRVRFVSTQDVASAPKDTPAPRLCWRVTLPMAGSPPRIDMTRGGSSVAQPC